MPRLVADRLGRSIFVVLALTAAAACAGSGGGSNAAGGASSPTPGGSATPSDAPDIAAKGSFDIALYVEETGGVAREGEPVRSGVPVPRTVDLHDTSSLEIVGPDGVVPSQIRVTSRWEGAPDDAAAPIKWLLVDFDANVPQNGSTIYRLRTRAGAQPATGTLVREDAADHVTIETGAATFTLSKTHFDLFHRVVLADGTAVVNADATTGGFLVLPDGTRVDAGAQTTEVAVEENGPEHAVIRARGRYADKLDWTARLHFWNGRADAKVVWTFTERSLASIRGFTTVSELGLDLPVATGASPRVAIGGESGATQGPLTNEAWQRQTGNLSPTLAANFNPGTADTIRFSNGGDLSGNGGKAAGWIDETGASAGVTAALRWYWETYPKKLDAKPGRLVVDLWPKEETPMRVYAAAQKSHEILYSFHGASSDAAATGAALTARLDHPLMARCNPSWYAGSRVWNRIGTADPASYAGDDATVASAYFQHLEGKAFPATFVTRPYDGNGAGHSYSMWDFGDGRESYWSNLAYDTPRSLFIHWAITGDRAFLDRGAEAAVHLRDVDIEHSPLDTRAGITSSRGIAQPWLGRTRYTPSQGPAAHDLGYEGRTGYGFEHSKGQGLADHYFLTGDRESLDVVAEAYHYYEQWKVDADSGFLRTDGTRVVSHMLLVLIGYYDAFGTSEARSRIDFCVNYLNDWQRRKTTHDPKGWMWMSASDTTATFMNSVTAEALMLYEQDFPDGIPVKQNLVDAAAWTIDPANGQLVHGAGGDYFNAWTNDNYGAKHATVLDAMIGPWMAYASDATGDPTYVETAKRVLTNSFAEDQSTPFIKAFTEQTRLVPAFLWFLETDAAKKQPAS